MFFPCWMFSTINLQIWKLERIKHIKFPASRMLKRQKGNAISFKEILHQSMCIYNEELHFLTGLILCVTWGTLGNYSVDRSYNILPFIFTFVFFRSLFLDHPNHSGDLLLSFSSVAVRLHFNAPSCRKLVGVT